MEVLNMTSERIITILIPFPKELDVNGDFGNIQTIQRRLTWYGYTPKVVVWQGGELPTGIDIMLTGGGMDSGLKAVYPHFTEHRDDFKAMAADGVAMLLVGGMYQMFGRSFMLDGNKLEGLGLLDVTSGKAPEKYDGNIVAQSSRFGEVVGYEIHETVTKLGPTATPLCETVTKGTGNNADDHNEGVIAGTLIGTYMNGPILPKNPAVADYLIEDAAKHRYGSFEPTAKPEDFPVAAFIDKARKVAASRPIMQAARI